MSCPGVRARQDVLQLMEEEGKQVDGGLWGRSKPLGMKGLWAQSWSAGLRMVSGGLVDIMQAECLVWWVVPNSYC